MRSKRKPWWPRWLERLGFSNPHVPARWLMIIAGAALGALILILIARPFVMPDDRVAIKTLSSEKGLVARMHLEPGSRRFWKLGSDSIRTSRPRYVSVKSNGPQFCAYLFDLRGLDAAASVGITMDVKMEKMDAYRKQAIIEEQALDVTEAEFGVPWGFSNTAYGDFMLVVVSEEEGAVTVTTSY